MVVVRTGVIAAIVLYAARASAQPAPDPKAAELFERGRDELKRGETEAACGSFAESFAIEPADGTELNLADCQERLGHLADAWRLFEQTATLSAGKGNDVRAAAARERATKLLPRIGQVVVELADPAQPGLALVIAGEPVPVSGQIQRKVDPGAIAIRATASGRTPFERTVTIAPDGTATLEIPALVDDGVAPTAPVTPQPPKVVTATSTHRKRSRVRIGELVGGVGVAGLVASGVVGLVARSNYRAQFSNGSCVTQGSAIDCTPIGKERANRAVSLGDTATVIGGVGLAAAIAGGVVWFTAPIEVSVTPSSASVALRGAF